MSGYTLGFSVPAFVALFILFLPNIVNCLMQPNKKKKKSRTNAEKIEHVLKILRGLCVALLVFVLNREYGNHISINSALILALLFLFIYIACWVQYLRGRPTPFGMIFGIALMQPLYMLSIGICLHNRLILLPCIPYAALSVLLASVYFMPRSKK